MGRLAAFMVLIAVVAAAASATPPTAVSENFGGSQFPPTGWTTEGSGQGNWSWSNPGGYARGTCYPMMYENLSTSLKSPPFAVSNGTILHVRFRYYAAFSGEGCALYVRIGSWYRYITYAPSWTWIEENTTVFTATGNLRVEWQISGNGGSHGNTAAWYIDDVLITRDNTAVEPHSLGRVKVIYR